MKRIWVSLFGCALVLALVAATPVLAHHGRGDTYETDSVIEIIGTINTVHWRNPHINFLVDVPGENGEVTTWTIEHSNVSTLARLGYSRTTLQPGMEVTVEINPGTLNRPIGLNRGVTLADGTKILMRGGNDSDRYNPLADID